DDKGEQYLFDNYEEFIRLYDNEYIIGALVDGFLIFSEELFANLRKKYAKYENEMNVLVQPYGETFNAREHRSLLKIAITAKTSKDQNLDKLLDEHRQTFHWMQNNYKNIEGLSLDYFKEKLDELLVKDIDVLKEELNALELAIKKHQDFCSAIKERSIFESADYEHLLWLGKIAWWVDRRKEYNLLANYYIGRHLRYLCEQKSLTYEDVVYLFPWELDSVLSGRTHLADYPLESRKGNWLHFYDVDDQELVMTSKDEKDFLQRALPKISNGQEVKGMIANKGKATGVVRVVMDAHNVKEFNEGEILVTGMTRPDFLGLMKKAAAFVTDEGGVTCHAAIVSRELGKPCIIGTKIATKVLKDGDLVEVDANKGIVNILEK
ncbi:hypothetical protein HGA64_03960, partial [Candidatus Falkowbacteria bacterium]|nr:hypothetical protein [Candidatus Falkowbacteria bacterium]